MEHTHGLDSEMTSNVGDIVNIELAEVDIREFTGEGYNLWCNKPTGTYSE